MFIEYIHGTFYHPKMEDLFPLKHNLNHQNGTSAIIRMQLFIFYLENKINSIAEVLVFFCSE